MYNPEYLEHDIYTLFEHLMHSLGYLYESKDAVRSTQDTSSKLQEKCVELFDWLNKYDSVYHVVLVKHDVQSIFAIKWLKLMFTREFPLDDAMLLWDAIFCYGEKLRLCDGIFLGMVHRVRGPIMEHNDPLFSMKQFTNFQATDNIPDLIHLAVNICNGHPPVIPKKPESHPSSVSKKITGFLYVCEHLLPVDT